MKKIVFLFALVVSFFSFSQEKLTYQKPSKEILELVDAPLAPSVLLTDDGKYMVLLYRDYYKTIAELSETELRLAGLRINPKTNIGSRTNYYNNIQVKQIGTDEAVQVKGVPENPRLANLKWSPDQSMIAFTNTKPDGVELWVLDLNRAQLTKLTEADINELDDYEERQLFLEDIGLDEPGSAKLIRSAYKLLNQQTYFTAGVKEVRAWTVTVGSTAPQAAGVIHTDFEKGFIRAEVISYTDYVGYGSEAKVKEAGKMRVEGKNYIVKDGDVMHFLFNV